MTFDQKSYMKEYRKKYMPSYRAANIEMFREFDKRRYHRVKNGAVALLGGQCAICEETESEFLTIDHVNGDGNSERSKLHHRQIWSRIVNKSVDLKRYRVLCRNCNSGLANELSLNNNPVSSHHFSGDACNKCGKPKLVRPSGKRKRIECPTCIKVRNQGLRIDAFTMFGSECKCCKERNVNKLTFDHINNDGSSMRPTDHCGTVYFYKRILSGKFISDVYQVLCWNCNFSKYLGDGLCVHQREE